jgi:hypothetical protein
LVLFLLILFAFLLVTWVVVFYIGALVKYDTLDYDMNYLWEEQEYSKEEFDYTR